MARGMSSIGIVMVGIAVNQEEFPSPPDVWELGIQSIRRDCASKCDNQTMSDRGDGADAVVRSDTAEL